VKKITKQAADKVQVANAEGAVRLKNGSTKLYIDFYYHGSRVVKSTGLKNTPENWLEAEDILAGLQRKKADGTLVFAKAFPGASESEKIFHAKHEGWEYTPEPHNVIFSDFVKDWLTTIWVNYPSDNKRDDLKQAIDDWLLPYFGSKTFSEITGTELQMFIGQLRWRTGKNTGKPLSGSRVRNIMIPLRTIWRNARSKFRWAFFEDPFEFIKDEKAIPKKASKKPVVFRFAEWKKVVGAMDTFYQPIAEIMIMSGLIGSEMAGLRKKDIYENGIHVVNKIVPRRNRKERSEKEELKNEYRGRTIPITREIQKRLEEVMARSSGLYAITMKDGSTYDPNRFRESVWETAFRRAGLPFKIPYTARHSFAAWALTLRMDPNRLVKLMGHNSKKMVYEVYGEYVEGLEDDYSAILEYFGEDFIARKRTAVSRAISLAGESFGESHGL
jgi:integrase